VSATGPNAGAGGLRPPRVIVASADERLVAAIDAAFARARPRADLEVVADGDEALARLAQGEYDALVADHWLPNKPGLEIVRFLRRSGDPVQVFLLCSPFEREVMHEAGSFTRVDVFDREEGPTLLPKTLRRILNVRLGFRATGLGQADWSSLESGPGAPVGADPAPLPPAVLVVEPEVGELRRLGALLRKAGFRVRSEPQPDQVVGLLAKPGYADVVVIEADIPDPASRKRLADSVAAQFPALGLVVLWSPQSQGTARRPRVKRAVAVLRKPIDEAAFLDAVRSAAGLSA
jgi:CheY-like chemotaxis protein